MILTGSETAERPESLYSCQVRVVTPRRRLPLAVKFTVNEPPTSRPAYHKLPGGHGSAAFAVAAMLTTGSGGPPTAIALLVAIVLNPALLHIRNS